ncbi:hypothetical protein MRX96_003775 [Rhipicephalus microplus]
MIISASRGTCLPAALLGHPISLKAAATGVPVVSGRSVCVYGANRTCLGARYTPSSRLPKLIMPGLCQPRVTRLASLATLRGLLACVWRKLARVPASRASVSRGKSQVSCFG